MPLGQLGSQFSNLDQVGHFLGIELDTVVTGGGGPPRKYKPGSYYRIMASTGDTTDVAVLNTVKYHPFPVWDAYSIDRISLGVSAAGGASSVVRLGLYASTATNLPGARLADWGTIDGTSNTYQEITITQALAANTLYWVAAVWQVGTAGSVRSIGTGDGSEWVAMDANSRDPRSSVYLEAGVTGALPATATPAAAPGTVPWSLRVRAG